MSRRRKSRKKYSTNYDKLVEKYSQKVEEKKRRKSTFWWLPSYTFLISCFVITGCLSFLFNSNSSRSLKKVPEEILPYLEGESKANNDTKNHWDLYSIHRKNLHENVIGLLNQRKTQDSFDSNSRDMELCILGAGNVNDIDLFKLLIDGSFHHIYAIDIDEKAVRAGIQRQFLKLKKTSGSEAATLFQQSIHVVAPMDVSGVAKILSSWKLRGKPGPKNTFSPSNNEIDKMLNYLNKASPHTKLPGNIKCDFVISDCILTQIMMQVTDSFSVSNPRFTEILLNIRNRHIFETVQLLNPGGLGLIVTDVSHSKFEPRILNDIPCDTCPQDSTLFPAYPYSTLTSQPKNSDKYLSSLLTTILYEKNHLSGSNPLAIEQQLLTHTNISPMVIKTSTGVSAPWKWTLNQYKTFLVVAIHFQRKET